MIKNNAAIELMLAMCSADERARDNVLELLAEMFTLDEADKLAARYGYDF